METSEVLRQAAKLIEDGKQRFTCVAVSVAARANHDHSYLCDAKERIFYQHALGIDGDATRFGDHRDPAVQGHRIVALCLVAAMSESKGD